MDFASINWLAVGACVVFTMVSGSLWFGPKTFFPIWWKAIGKGDETPGSASGSGVPMAVTWALVVVTSLVVAIAMAFIVNALGGLMGGPTAINGALTGFMLWLGFVAPTGLTNKLFADQYKAWFLEQGLHLINFVVMGVILGVWQ